MSIERLNKAATAAGFAMATPDDDVADATETVHSMQDAPSRAVVVAEPPQRPLASGTDISVAAWLKGFWPSFGGRQPA